MHAGRTGNRDFREDTGVVLHEGEVLEHRVVLREAELAVDHRMHRRDLRAVELHALSAGLHVHAVQHAHEIEMPEGATRFTVGDNLQADLFLHLDEFRDLRIFDGAQGRRIGAGGACLGNRARAKKTADMVGAERWCRHADPPVDVAHSGRDQKDRSSSSVATALPIPQDEPEPERKSCPVRLFRLRSRDVAKEHLGTAPPLLACRCSAPHPLLHRTKNDRPKVDMERLVAVGDRATAPTGDRCAAKPSNGPAKG